MKFDLEIIKYFQVFDLSSFFPFYSLVSKFIELYTNFQINFHSHCNWSYCLSIPYKGGTEECRLRQNDESFEIGFYVDLLKYIQTRLMKYFRTHKPHFSPQFSRTSDGWAWNPIWEAHFTRGPIA